MHASWTRPSQKQKTKTTERKERGINEKSYRIRQPTPLLWTGKSASDKLRLNRMDSDLDAGHGQHLPDERSALADDVAHQGLGHSDLGELTGETRQHKNQVTCRSRREGICGLTARGEHDTQPMIEVKQLGFFTGYQSRCTPGTHRVSTRLSSSFVGRTAVKADTQEENSPSHEDTANKGTPQHQATRKQPTPNTEKYRQEQQ